MRVTDLKANYLQPFWTRAVRPRSEGFLAIAERSRDDSRRLLDLVEIPLSVEGVSARTAEKPSDTEVAARSVGHLKERPDLYWQAMLKDDYRAAYPLLDPYFRAAIALHQYLNAMGRVKYHGFSIGDVQIEDNIAQVPIKIDASVPEFTVMGKVMMRDKAEISFTETWLFIDGSPGRTVFGNSGLRSTKQFSASRC